MKINKHRALLLKQVKESDIVDEVMGNDRYVAITKDTVYFVSIGISAGFFFSKKVKSFPMDQITSVDIGRKLLAGYMELTAAGMGGGSHAGASYSAMNENRVFFKKNLEDKFHSIANQIRELRKKSS